MTEQIVEKNRSLAKRVGIIGTPGAGKSTVCQALQVDMGSTDLITAVCPEEARIFITKFGQPEHPAVQSSLLYKQMRREDTLAESCDLLFCDSPIYLCYLYALLQHDPISKQQTKIVRDLYKWAVLDNLRRYDVLILLPRQFVVVDDGCRDPNATDLVEKAITGFLDLHRSSFKNFIEIRSEETDPQEILKDRVKLAKKEVRKLL